MARSAHEQFDVVIYDTAPLLESSDASLIAREARKLEGSRRERALDAYAKARELAVIAPRVSLDPAATVFQIGGILASVADAPLP